MSHLSQVGLLIVAVVVYFYTVVPVYQKSVLDEEIAKRTLDLRILDSQLAEAKGKLTEVTQQLVGANERATRLYIELRAYVASRAITDMSAACSTPWPQGAESLIKFSIAKPRTVKVTDNLLAMCTNQQFMKAGMAKELGKLSPEDQNLFREVVVAAAREAAPKIEAHLREAKKRDLESRAKVKQFGAIVPELAEDEIALHSLAFWYFGHKTATSDLIFQALTDSRTRQDAYAKIVSDALFGALDRFLKARPPQ